VERLRLTETGCLTSAAAGRLNAEAGCWTLDEACSNLQAPLKAFAHPCVSA
jgi:hypothetical protein